jgi:hypothetical protein
MALTTETIIAKASTASFGKPLIENTWRAIVVEAIVSSALPPDWRWCAADWAGWDFEHSDGTRLEVKQSAARQSWSGLPKRAHKPRFDIASRTGYWTNGATWVPSPGRSAQIYLFAYHPITDDSADHRDPLQWTFYVVQTRNLPVAGSISLVKLAQSLTPVGVNELAASIEAARLAVQKP